MDSSFGDLIKQHLNRKRGLSQSHMAAATDINASLISRMVSGELLNVPSTRWRIMQMIKYLHDHEVLEFIEEADAILQAAGKSKLGTDQQADPAALKIETDLIHALKKTNNISQRKIYGTVPSKPLLFIGREVAMEEIRERLKSVTNISTNENIHAVTTLRGWAGVGKSTIAAAIAHDEDIWRVFTDGVLWASIGQQPDIFATLRTWAHALEITELSHIKHTEELSNKLRVLLHDKRMLLIVDDVWDIKHAFPFQIGGRHCAHLITTRDRELALQIAPTPNHIYTLAVLEDDAGVKLLEMLAPSVVGTNRQKIIDLVRALEGLPLALQVAGRLLHSEAELGWDIEDLLADLQGGDKILEAPIPADLASQLQETTPTVRTLLKKSTDRLDPQARQFFALLGAFAPEPATFDLERIKLMWETPDPTPGIRILVNRGLLEPIGNGWFQMHALLAAHARSLLSRP